MKILYTILLLLVVLQPALAQELEVHFVDVGQGDCILIKTPSKSILVDAGGPEAGDEVVSYLLAQNISELDLVIATHMHSDHIGGLVSQKGVLENIEVKEIWDNGQRCDECAEYENYINLVQSQNRTIVSRGDSRAIDGLNLSVLNPSQEFLELINDNSIVLKASYGEIDFLLTADCEEECERELVSSGINLDSEILKVPHHGSSTSTTSYFLREVSPEVAVIQAGENNDRGHPHNLVLLKLIATTTYRTDLNGNIVISTDGETFQVRYDKQHNNWLSIFLAIFILTLILFCVIIKLKKRHH